MIGWLSGQLRSIREPHIVLDVGGVGYLVTVTPNTLAGTAVGEALDLHIHTHVREDTLALYGFENEASLHAFHTLLGVNGVGPKLALGILGHLPPDALADAVETGDIARLKGCPGVGKRVAERLSLELKGKLSGGEMLPGQPRALPSSGPWADLRSALGNLGYRRKEIDSAITQLERTHADSSLDALLREALTLLRR